MNREDPNANRYLYREFPEHYTWNKAQKCWNPRKRRFHIGKLVYANHAEGERYYLCVLLNHVRGPTSFTSLHTVRGVVQPIFRRACEILGLVEAGKSLDDALSEATMFKMPSALRKMFATIMVFCEFTNIQHLWDNHFDAMAEDYRHTHANDAGVLQLVLKDIANIVKSMGKDINNYSLPELHESGISFMLLDCCVYCIS